jgi:hypothetical protein
MGKEDNMRNHSPPRGLRDVRNVEEYVRLAVELVAPTAAGERRSALQAHGVRAVRRVERALPPGVPLAPVLDAVLPGRLAALDDAFAGAAVAAVA